MNKVSKVSPLTGAADTHHEHSVVVLDDHPVGWRERVLAHAGLLVVCHVVKSTGKAGQKDVSVEHDALAALLNFHRVVELLSLRVRCRRLLLSLPRCLHQLAHLHARGQLDLVRKGNLVESSLRVLLVCAVARHAVQPLTQCYSCFNAFSRVDVRGWVGMK